MTKIPEIYRCRICGNTSKRFKGTHEILVCCGEKMKLLEDEAENTSIEKSVSYLEWIEMIKRGGTTNWLEVYKCTVCGNIAEIFHGSCEDLVCCGKKMVLQEEQTADTSLEKHVPYIEEIDGGYRVRVGENAEHPMVEDHYIEWIEMVADNRVYREYLKPGDKPEALFMLEADKVIVREYCNIHGHWQNNK